MVVVKAGDAWLDGASGPVFDATLDDGSVAAMVVVDDTSCKSSSGSESVSSNAMVMLSPSDTPKSANISAVPSTFWSQSDNSFLASFGLIKIACECPAVGKSSMRTLPS